MLPAPPLLPNVGALFKSRRSQLSNTSLAKSHTCTQTTLGAPLPSLSCSLYLAKSRVAARKYRSGSSPLIPPFQWEQHASSDTTATTGDRRASAHEAGQIEGRTQCQLGERVAPFASLCMLAHADLCVCARERESLLWSGSLKCSCCCHCHCCYFPSIRVGRQVLRQRRLV